MKHEVLIYNKTKHRVSEKLIKSVISGALEFLEIKQPVELAVLVVDRAEIKLLNKVWRKKDEIPDELSFGLNSRLPAGRVKFAKDGINVISLGEIVLNVDKISNKNYLSKLLIHSLLHLLGYSHKQMERVEVKVFKHLNI